MTMLGKKGQAQIGVIGFVVFAISVIIGAIVFGQFDTAAGTIGLNTAATAAVANVTSNTYNGFNIVSIGPIVFAAVVILGIVGLLTVGRR